MENSMDISGERCSPSGYSIYNADAKKRRMVRSGSELFPPLPDKRYQIIYADPPWDYGGKVQFDRSSRGRDSLDVNKKIFISSAEFKYPTLKLNELAMLDVEGISCCDCLLFMWTTGPQLENSIILGRKWGFEYRTIGFMWDKMCHNPGKYTMSGCELCLIFKRGKIPMPRGARNVSQMVRIPRGEHSRKPAAVRKSIEDMFPTQSKIELFSRDICDGWDSWGMDVNK